MVFVLKTPPCVNFKTTRVAREYVRVLTGKILALSPQ